MLSQDGSSCALQAPGYRPDIDGLRAVAVLAVMVGHLGTGLLPGGFVGVDVFFVISGFVVTASLVSSNAPTLGGFISEFYARRLARIVPALVLVVLVTAMAAVLFIPQAWLSAHGDNTARYALFGLSNWFLQTSSGSYFAPRSEFNPYTHTWSLGVEEQFYLVAPLLVWFWIRAAREQDDARHRRALVTLWVLAASSLALCAWATVAPHPSLAFYFIGSRLWELAAGAGLFLTTYRTAPQWRWRRTSAAAPWLGLLAIAAALVLAREEHFPWPWAALPVAGTLLLIGGSNAPIAHPVRRLLGSRPALWIGLRSYSLYLWHWPVYTLMRWTIGLETALQFVCAVAIATLLAAASYRWVERPLRHHQQLEALPRVWRIAAVGAAPALCLLVITAFFDSRPQLSLATASRHPSDWQATQRMHFDGLGTRQCQVDVTTEQVHGQGLRVYTPRDCTSKPARGRLFVLGDSHAGAISAMLEQYSAERGVPVSLFSTGSCGYIDLRSPMDGRRTVSCRRYVRALTDYMLEQLKPGDMVLLPSLRLERYGDQWGDHRVADMFELMHSAATQADRHAAIADAEAWLRPLALRGARLVFMAPTPVFKAPPFRCVDWFNRHNPICVGDNRQDRAVLDRLREPVLEQMRQIGKRLPTVSVWDPFPSLCPGQTCEAMRDGRPLFFDGDHLSANGNRVLYPDFSSALRALDVD